MQQLMLSDEELLACSGQKYISGRSNTTRRVGSMKDDTVLMYVCRELVCIEQCPSCDCDET